MRTERDRITKQEYEALAAFRAAIRRFVRSTEERARAAGITPQQHQAMLAVMGHQGRSWASIAEIADSLQLRHHSAVELVDRCVAAGLLVRRHESSDRRQVAVCLTELGSALLDRLSSENLRELRTLRRAVQLDLLIERRNRGSG